MSKKGPPQNTRVVLEDTLVDSHFALAQVVDPVSGLPVANDAFQILIDPLGTLPGGPYDYAYVNTKASLPGQIEIGSSLAALNGIVASGNGKDDIDLSRSTGDNLVFAGNGNDKVKGGDGDEFAFGGNGNDELRGEEGNDYLDGGNGVDELRGGEDAGTATVVTTTGNPVVTLTVGDVLTGGKSPDTFVYELGDGVDRITDFRVGQDKLKLEGITLAQLKSTTDGQNLYIGFDDGTLAHGWAANSIIQIDGVTDINTLLNANGILFS